MHFYLCVWVFLQVHVATLSLCCFKSVAASVLFTIIYVYLSINKVICIYIYSLHSFNVLPICWLSNFDKQKMRKISPNPSVHETSISLSSVGITSRECMSGFLLTQISPGLPHLQFPGNDSWRPPLSFLRVSHGSAVPVFVTLLIPATLTFNLSPHLVGPPGPCLGKDKESQLCLLCSLLGSWLLPLFFLDRPGSQLLFLTQLPCAQRMRLHCQNVTVSRTTLKRVQQQQYFQNLRLSRLCTASKTSKDNLEFCKRSVNREQRTLCFTQLLSAHTPV